MLVLLDEALDCAFWMYWFVHSCGIFASMLEEYLSTARVCIKVGGHIVSFALNNDPA